MNINNKHIFTVDVEDWYLSSLELFDDADNMFGKKPDKSVIKNTLYTLDLLDKFSNKATFFILGPVAENYPDLVKEIKMRGHEIASHGYSHMLNYKITPQQFEDDLKKSLDFLSKADCDNIKGYRAPYWSIKKENLWALDIIKKIGLEYDSSIFPIKRGLYGIPDFRTDIHKLKNGLWEVPPSTIRIGGINIPIAGGGYLRMIPYFILKSLINKAAKKNMVFYCHPYEVDPNDLKIKHRVKSLKTVLYWIQQAIGRKNNPDKLNKLISDFSYTTIINVIEQYKNEQEDHENSNFN